MPQWAGSCWYYLRYLDTANGRRFASREAERYWMGSERTAGMVPLIQAVEWPKIARNLTERAFDDGKRPPFAVEFSRVSDDLAARIRQLCGEDVSDFRHSLDVYAVRHAFREHGIGPLEATRGNIAITIEDIERLPEILEHPDSVSFDDVHKPGCKRFVITKRINGIIFVVEEEKSRRGQLQVVTFWKKKATARDVTTRAPLSNTSENDRRSEATKSTDQSAVKPTPGVDLYVGGTEHAVLHLLYARFWHKVLYDLGHVSTPEPFFKLVNQGLILGELEFFAFAPSGRLPEGFVSSELVKDIKEQAGTLVGTHKATGETMVGRKLSGHEKDVEKRGEHFYLKLQSQIRVEARSFKMSKARGNVVNPDEVVREFGADSLRLYEMFMGPLQDTKPWNTNGVEGVYRFLGRVWRLFIDEKAETAFEQAETTTPAPTDELLDILVLNGAISDMAAAPAQLKALHACIKKVTEDLDGMRFNTAISAMMVFVNEANTWQTRPLPLMRTFLQLLAPFAPHVAEELWSRLHSTFGQVAPSLIYAPWPKFDPSLLVESEIEIPVSVNGKLRDLIRVATDADSSTLEAAARSAEKVKPYLEGKTVKKVIVVPRKMVNIVVT
ncbi:MAG: hypothetical protein EXS31_16160 [Pedosphaera sp.]|nr:hypothetical protein [Pedosphaera sp.]